MHGKRMRLELSECVEHDNSSWTTASGPCYDPAKRRAGRPERAKCGSFAPIPRRLSRLTSRSSDSTEVWSTTCATSQRVAKYTQNLTAVPSGLNDECV